MMFLNSDFMDEKLSSHRRIGNHQTTLDHRVQKYANTQSIEKDLVEKNRSYFLQYLLFL